MNRVVRFIRTVPTRSFSTSVCTRYAQEQNAVNKSDLKYALPPDPEKWTEGSTFFDENAEESLLDKTKNASEKKDSKAEKGDKKKN
jgi:hypothetical protein